MQFTPIRHFRWNPYVLSIKSEIRTQLSKHCGENSTWHGTLLVASGKMTEINMMEMEMMVTLEGLMLQSTMQMVLMLQSAMKMVLMLQRMMLLQGTMQMVVMPQGLVVQRLK